MKNADRVKEIFNNGQNEFDIDKIEETENSFYVSFGYKNNYRVVSFYDWLINNEFDTFKVFKINLFTDILRLFDTDIGGGNYRIKQPEEILTYLADRSRE